jgi:DNA replication protein DnaC
MGIAHYRRTEWCTCEAAGKAQEEQAERIHQEALAEKLSELLGKAKIGVGRYARMKFDTWDVKRHPKAKKHLQDVMSYCAEVTEDGANLCYLHGKYGRGKTHLAIAALRHITRLHLEDMFVWHPYFVEWLAHCSEVQQSWDEGSFGPTEGQLWGRMKNATILVIDDVDKGRPSEWAMGKLLEVAQHRYVREKPTIVTANHSLQELQQAWEKSEKGYVRDAGGAITSRWMGQLWGQIEVTGPDQRDA